MKKISIKNNFKKGAASFYIVAFSTLILVIITASFAAIIISEIARTSNDDLAQSAYDSALAGVEDAKLAYYNYQNCIKDNSEISLGVPEKNNNNCKAIRWFIENGEKSVVENDGVVEYDSCDMVARILGRKIEPIYGFENSEDGEGANESNKGVLIAESNINNNMLQAYTCVKVVTGLNDYEAAVSSSNPTTLVPVRLGDDVAAKDIKSIRFSWGSKKDTGINNTYAELNNDGMLVFSKGNGFLLDPPVMAVTLIQTGGDSFGFESFDMSYNDDNDEWSRTNRGTIYLVPYSKDKEISSSLENNYELATYSDGKNLINKKGFLKSNDKTRKNVPYLVKCDKGGESEYACSVDIELPSPRDGDRSDKTFMFVVSWVSGEATRYNMAFCKDSSFCTGATYNDDGTIEDAGNIVTLNGMQIEIDSTGRANDLFRRVVTRLNPTDSTTPPLYAIELLDQKPEGKSTLKKDLSVRREYNF